MSKFKFSYDEASDDLLLYDPLEKSKGSVEMGDLIFDLNRKGFVGLQILNASSFIAELVGEKAASVKKILRELSTCTVVVKERSNMLIVRMKLSSKTGDVFPVLSLPNIHESSPALSMN